MKRNVTIDDYIIAGAYSRLCKYVLAKTTTALSRVMLKKDSDKLLTVNKRLNEIISTAEDEMFKRFSDLDNSYTNVFYGSIDINSRSLIDVKVKNTMLDIIDDAYTKALTSELTRLEYECRSALESEEDNGEEDMER